MQFQVLFERGQPQHALQRALAHLMHVRESHVIRDQGDHLIDLGV